MDDEIVLLIDPEVRTEIAAELGSMNVFYDRLGSLVARESRNRASISESSEALPEGVGARGAEVIAIITAVSGMIATLSPIVIAWIRSRSFEVEEKVETRKTGTVVRTLRVRRGTMR
jgi:hypothetical protein